MHEYLCFINASSYFISFYDKRKVKQNFPRLAI